MSVVEIEDLRWFYHDSDAELGYRSPMGAMLEQARIGVFDSSLVARDTLAETLQPGWISAPVPSMKQRKAAAKQQAIKRALDSLSYRYQEAIFRAYEARQVDNLPLLSRYGVAAGLIVAVQRIRSYEEGQAKRLVREAAATHRRVCSTASAERLAMVKRELREQQKMTASLGDACVALLKEAQAAYLEARRRQKAMRRRKSRLEVEHE